MKKILLATSAVALFAGAAAAEITTTGSARMGLVYADDGTDSTTQFSSRVRIVFTASGETDTGLSFGASMRADQIAGNGGSSTGTTNGDSTVFISGSFGKLTMGDVSGAADALVGQTSGVGYGPNDALQEIAFIGTAKTAAYYEYSSGAFTFGLGAGQIDADYDLFGLGVVPEANTYNVGVKYSTDAYSVALAWETIEAGGDSLDMLSLGGSATFGAATVKARVSDLNESGFDTAYSLSVDYAMGATTLTAFYTDYGNSSFALNSEHVGLLGEDTSHVGIGASYDLGGGATVAGGIVMQNNDITDDQTFADVGLKFTF